MLIFLKQLKSYDQLHSNPSYLIHNFKLSLNFWKASVSSCTRTLALRYMLHFESEKEAYGVTDVCFYCKKLDHHSISPSKKIF